MYDSLLHRSRSARQGLPVVRCKRMADRGSTSVVRRSTCMQLSSRADHSSRPCSQEATFRFLFFTGSVFCSSTPCVDMTRLGSSCVVLRRAVVERLSGCNDCCQRSTSVEDYDRQTKEQAKQEQERGKRKREARPRPFQPSGLLSGGRLSLDELGRNEQPDGAKGDTRRNT